MKRRDDLLLSDIIGAANEIASYLVGQTVETYLEDGMRRDAALMRLLVIGEAAARLPQDLRDRHPNIEWRPIIGFRNRAIHAYRNVDRTIVWNAAAVNVPVLADQIAAILDQEFPATEAGEPEQEA
jgi:uncharacterized protein with HEPN domain